MLAVLSDQKLEAAKRAALVTTALQWMIDHVPTALLPPQIGLVMSLIRGIIPALGYIGEISSSIIGICISNARLVRWFHRVVLECDHWL